MKSLAPQFWQYIEKNRGKKRFDRIYNWLNQDNLSDIVLDGQVFWFELTCPSTNTIPNTVYEFMKKWSRKQGYTYLFDLPEHR